MLQRRNVSRNTSADAILELGDPSGLRGSDDGCCPMECISVYAAQVMHRRHSQYRSTVWDLLRYRKAVSILYSDHLIPCFNLSPLSCSTYVVPNYTYALVPAETLRILLITFKLKL